MHNNIEQVKVHGTSYSGCITGLNYDEMVALIGEPNFPGDGYKIDVEWGLRFVSSPGRVFGIWNYKNGPSYVRGATLNDINRWSLWVSKNDSKMHELLEDIFGEHLSLNRPVAVS